MVSRLSNSVGLGDVRYCEIVVVGLWDSSTRQSLHFTMGSGDIIIVWLASWS